MTRREIEKALPFWKSLLRLEDWRIDARTVTAAELRVDGIDHDGYTIFHPEEMYANITLRRGETEETLVHELLHLVFDGDMGRINRPYSVPYERAINRCAEALTRLASTLPRSWRYSIPGGSFVADEVNSTG